MRRLLIALLLTATAAGAQEPFEAALSGWRAIAACAITPLPTWVVQWFDPDREFEAFPITQIASGDHRRVFGLHDGFRVHVVELSPSGAQTTFFNDLPGATPRAIAVAATGRIFVTYLRSGSPNVAVISPAGALEATYPLPGFLGLAQTAVAPDGCTLFFRKDRAIGRFGACTGTPLADFTVFSEVVADFEVLPDGRVLVATLTDVRLYEASGALARTVASRSTYGFSSEFELDQAALSADGESVYITAMNRCDQTGFLLQVRFDTGAEISRRPVSLVAVTGLVTGGGAAAVAAAVPAASTPALLALAVILAFAAVSLLKR